MIWPRALSRNDARPTTHVDAPLAGLLLGQTDALTSGIV